MKVINLFSGPSGGKSTTAAGLFYKMKLNHMSVELVPEYAKKLLHANRLNGMLDQQEYIFAKQNAMLHPLRGRVDFAVTDSPLLLSNVYAQKDWECYEQFRALVIATYNTYDNINIVLNRPPIFELAGRRHSEEESELLDDDVMREIKSCVIDYHVFDCNATVVEDILNSGLVT